MASESRLDVIGRRLMSGVSICLIFNLKLEVCLLNYDFRTFFELGEMTRPLFLQRCQTLYSNEIDSTFLYVRNLILHKFWEWSKHSLWHKLYVLSYGPCNMDYSTWLTVRFKQIICSHPVRYIFLFEMWRNLSFVIL